MNDFNDFNNSMMTGMIAGGIAGSVAGEQAKLAQEDSSYINIKRMIQLERIKTKDPEILKKLNDFEKQLDSERQLVLQQRQEQRDKQLAWTGIVVFLSFLITLITLMCI